MSDKIKDILRRKNNDEKITQEEDWVLHKYFYANDEQYRKDWIEALERNFNIK